MEYALINEDWGPKSTRGQLSSSDILAPIFKVERFGGDSNLGRIKEVKKCIGNRYTR